MKATLALTILAVAFLSGCTGNNNIPKEDISAIKWLASTEEVIAATNGKDRSIEKLAGSPDEISFIRRSLENRFIGETKIKSVAYDFASKDEKYPHQLTWIEYEFGDGYKKPTAIFSGAIADFGKPEFDLHNYSGRQFIQISKGAPLPTQFNARIAVWRIKHTTIQLKWEGDSTLSEYRLEMFFDPDGVKLGELQNERKNFISHGARDAEK